MAAKKRSVQMTFRKLDQIIDNIHDEKLKQELLIIQSEVKTHYEEANMQHVKLAVDFYLSHTEQEPFYQQLKELDKEKIAAHIGKSRSYVYNAIRNKTLKNHEKESIQENYAALL